MTAAPVPSAPDRRAHEQQQLAEALDELWLPRNVRDAVVRSLLAPDGAVTILAAERVAEALEAAAAALEPGGAGAWLRARARAVRAAAPPVRWTDPTPEVVLNPQRAVPQPTDRQEQDRG